MKERCVLYAPAIHTRSCIRFHVAIFLFLFQLKIHGYLFYLIVQMVMNFVRLVRFCIAQQRMWTKNGIAWRVQYKFSFYSKWHCLSMRLGNKSNEIIIKVVSHFLSKSKCAKKNFFRKLPFIRKILPHINYSILYPLEIDCLLL